MTSVSVGTRERQAHAERVAQLKAALAGAVPGSASASGPGPRSDLPWRLRRDESNLFRERAGAARRDVDLRAFTHVIEVAASAGWVDVEGSTPFDALVEATLAAGVMPQVVPQLKSITVGGAVAGVGIEASSFRHGLVHHGVLELEVLLADGSVVVCRPGGEHADLFHAFPNSYGTLGYALRVRLRTRPVRAMVRVDHHRFDDGAGAFAALARFCDDPAADFVDGVVFDRGCVVISVARFVEEAPWASDYHYERIYYRSLRERDHDYLTARDYLWRWDTDWFWCSKNFGLDRPWLRKLVGRERLNSRTYTRWMRWNERHGVTRRLNALLGRPRESVIQDVDVPIGEAAGFLDFLLREIGILPIWICPLRGDDDVFPLYPLAAGALYANFGFWDTAPAAEGKPPGHLNRLIEHEVMRRGGIKSLYSDSYFSRDEFAAAYGVQAYEAVKARYDPQRRLPGLYEKCVLRH